MRRSLLPRFLHATPVLAALAVSGAMVGQAQAAPDTWSGFYVGADLGYGMGATKLVIGDFFEWNALGSQGGSVGAFAGYNQQFGDWVAGFEFGGTLSDVQGHTELVSGPDSIGTQTLTDWSAGVTARLGYVVSPSTLVFAGLGGKVYHGLGRLKEDGITQYEDDDQFTGMGVVTVGIETVLSGNVRIRAQYDLDLLQANDYGGLVVTPMVGTAKASILYAIGDAAASEPVDAAKWAGFYAGAVGGQTIGVATLRIGDDTDYFSHAGFGSAGWTGGVVAGYNLSVTERLLLGFEGGVSASTSRTFVGLATEEDGFQGTNDWWIDARLRAGYLTSQETMLYGFAGLTRMHSTLGTVDDGEWTGGETTFERNGATIGAGIEAQVTDNLLLRAEYAYSLFEEYDMSGGGGFMTLTQRQQTATVGVIYRFNE